MRYMSFPQDASHEDENEQWKDIDWTEGLYQVSTLGRVARVHAKGGGCPLRTILKPMHSTIKYPTVHLSINTRRKRCTIHRLVANAFLPNPLNLPQVNHKDENPDNNRVENLEWCTEIYNHNYGTCIQRSHEKISTKVAIEINGELRHFPSIRECARQTGMDRGKIRRINELHKFL